MKTVDGVEPADNNCCRSRRIMKTSSQRILNLFLFSGVIDFIFIQATLNR